MDDIPCIDQRRLGELRDPLLVDVREPGEFSAERLTGSVNLPLSSIEAGLSSLPKDRPVVLLCRSGRRSLDAARRLAAAGFGEVYVLEGGLGRCAGVEKGPGGAWAMERQVRLAAGSLVLLGALAGWLLHPAGFLLSAAVGAGLVYSAVTDTCGMALVLARLPWNRSRPCAPRS